MASISQVFPPLITVFSQSHIYPTSTIYLTHPFISGGNPVYQNSSSILPINDKNSTFIQLRTNLRRKRNKDMHANNLSQPMCGSSAQSQNFAVDLWIPKHQLHNAFVKTGMWNQLRSWVSIVVSAIPVTPPMDEPWTGIERGIERLSPLCCHCQVNKKAVRLAPSFQDPRKGDSVCKTELSVLLPLGKIIYPLNGWKNQRRTRSTSSLVLQ